MSVTPEDTQGGPMNAMPWHGEPWAQLRRRRERDAMPHALLLAGPEGLGKRVFLDRLQRALLCDTPVDYEACGHCRGCLLHAAGSHPDVIAIRLGLRKDGTPRSDIVIDQIRDLSSRLAMVSQLGGWQVASIDPADAMNAPAANALLKTLEEPTRQTMLILVADAPWRLPATIRSRTQRLDFHLPPKADALAWLHAEGVAQPETAWVAANGNPGLARTWAGADALQQRAEVRRDMQALASGRGDTVEVARRWQAGATPHYLWFAAQAAADEARARVTGQDPPLGSTMDELDLDAWFASANRARETLRGPLRVDLVLLALLAQWR